MRQFVVFAGVFAAYLRNNSCINLLVRQFFSLECCAKQNQLIREGTRRTPFCPRRTRRGAENSKGVADSLCAAAPPFDGGGRPPALRSAAICPWKLILPFLLSQGQGLVWVFETGALMGREHAPAQVATELGEGTW